MTRITGGQARGRRLIVPSGRGIRPAADRVREALFNILASQGAAIGSVADLYAGAGHYGLEALSRGAQQALFVDRSRSSLLAAQENARRVGLEHRCQWVRQDVRTFLRRPPEEAFDLIVLDPPYDMDAGPPLLTLSRSPLVGDHTVVVVEHEGQQDVAAQGSLEVKQRRRYGRTTLTFLGRMTPPQA